MNVILVGQANSFACIERNLVPFVAFRIWSIPSLSLSVSEYLSTFSSILIETKIKNYPEMQIKYIVSIYKFIFIWIAAKNILWISQIN